MTLKPLTNSPMNNSDEDNEVTFHLIKGSQFRNIYLDGAYGSLSPHNKIHVTLYAERNPIPQRITFDVADGLEAETSRECKDGVIRDVEANLVMDPSTAQLMIELLQACIAEHKEFSSGS